MKKIVKILALLAILSIGLFVVGCSSSNTSDKANKVTMSKELYTCGMHPNVIQEGPGNCPICGMNLTPMNNETGMDSDDNAITIDPVTVQNMGVRTTIVAKRNLSQNIRTIGRIDFDETQVGYVQTKFAGWVEKMYVDKTGQTVQKGYPLFEIYSPQLVTAQEEYIQTYNRLKQAEVDNNSITAGNLKSMLNSTRNRLLNFDITEGQIENLENNQKISRTLTVHSPYGGIVDKKHVQEGMEIKPGMKLYTISDVKNIWVYADIYEHEIPLIREGNKATMSLSYLQSDTFNGKVDYIYPYLEAKTRTLKVRLSFPNRDNILKPGMYANVNISSAPMNNAIAVPTEAVMFSGERNLVFISKGDGLFEPREVVIGLESNDGYFEVKEGLEMGEKVVTSSQFLLDSESKLQESLSKMMSSSNNNSADIIDHSKHNH